MKRLLQLLLFALAAPAATAADFDPRIADWLLAALVAGDEAALREVANNDRILDAESVSWLIGGADVHPGGKPELQSARQVLQGTVLQKIVVTEQLDGPTIVEVIFLPTTTAASFGELALMQKNGESRNFRDYMMCEFVIDGGQMVMRNVCFADTDVF